MKFIILLASRLSTWQRVMGSSVNNRILMLTDEYSGMGMTSLLAAQAMALLEVL